MKKFIRFFKHLELELYVMNTIDETPGYFYDSIGMLPYFEDVIWIGDHHLKNLKKITGAMK